MLCNYRSVPKILDLFNGMFYHHELRAMVGGGSKLALLNTVQSALPVTARAMDMGVFFYGVFGTCQMSSNSPSWLNPKEAEVVLHLARKLHSLGIAMDNIGVISPYQGQVRYLRRLMANGKNSHLQGIMVGSVEQFQGQE